MVQLGTHGSQRVNRTNSIREAVVEFPSLHTKVFKIWTSNITNITVAILEEDTNKK